MSGKLKYQKKMIRKFTKILVDKMEGKHPSQKEMLALARELMKHKKRIQFKVRIHRPFEENNPFSSTFGFNEGEDTPDKWSYASYMQFITIHLYSCYSNSEIIISSLPFQDVVETLHLTREDFESVDEEPQWEEEWIEIRYFKNQ